MVNQYFVHILSPVTDNCPSWKSGRRNESVLPDRVSNPDPWLMSQVPYWLRYVARLWNQCINVEVMPRTSSVHDDFFIWPSSVTLTFNLLEQMFQMALLLLKENNCTKLFWDPCINVQVMAQTSSIYDQFIIWPSSVTLIFNLPS